MSGEITNITEADNFSFIMTNGSQDVHINGISNGYVELISSHKSSSKYKDKDKYRDKDRRGSSNRDKESSDKHNSSRSKDKYRDKDREREKDREKDKHKSSSHKSSSRDKYKEREKDSNKEKDRNRDREKDKHRERDKEKPNEKSERDNDKRDRDNDRKHRKEHKSSNSDKDRKDRDRDRHRKESSRDRDRDRNREHHKNSKDKHSNSSSSKSRDKDRDKEKHSRDKDRSAVTEIKYHDEHNMKGYNDCTVVLDNSKINPSDGFAQVYNYDFPEKDIKLEKYGYESKTEFKEDPPILNMSQASSCDYSMSQFRDDEPSFVIKHDMTDESQNNTMDGYNSQIKMEYENDDDDVPLANRKAAAVEENSDDDVPLVSRKQIKVEKQNKIKKEKKDKKEKKAERKRRSRDDGITEPKKKKMKKEEEVTIHSTKGRKKKENEEENQDVWRWWEEEKRDDGVKWHYLEHKGPVFAPPYDKLPDNINFYYDGKLMKLSTNAEEVASFYAKMLNHDYVTKKVFNDNFFKDWRKSMTSKEKDIIRDLSKCNFKQMHEYFLEKSEQNKNRSKDEKKALKEKNEELIKEYGYCIIDGHKERIGNFKLEPPGLFRGRGEHPKMGLVKRRVMPEDVSINCSKDSKIPQPPSGHRWKEIRHDNTVTWLASWIENVQGQVKYIMLNPSSKLKGEKDYQKYEVARRLDKQIDKIRATYRDEWKSKEMRIRQRGVALYFIDRLALRAGNEKDEDQADTVGCCSLRVEHVQLHRELNGKENVVVFDFLGKDSIRYYNEVEVEKRVFKNLELFMENKKEGDDLFDRLNTAILNEHLRDIMEGLTAKVFRTYNASITLQNQLDLLTDPDVSIHEKLLAYNRANRAVAVLCNHQRSIPKSHAKSMENLKEKIRQKKEAINEAALELKDLQKQAKRGSVKEKMNADKKSTQLGKLKEQLKKLELQETDRDENKTIALGTSKLNYLDPRISVAWCKKYGVPIEKIFNKTHREKFRWAIHMADENYRF